MSRTLKDLLATGAYAVASWARGGQTLGNPGAGFGRGVIVKPLKPRPYPEMFQELACHPRILAGHRSHGTKYRAGTR